MRVVWVLVSGVALFAFPVSQQAKGVVPTGDNFVITKDTVLKPGTYKLRDGDKNGAIRITKDGVTLDGAGAVLDGQALEGFGVLAEGVTKVTIKNLVIKGYAAGIKLVKAKDCTIEKNVLSENYSNPAAQWEKGPDGGGLVLEEVSGSTIRDNVATKNWNGISMIRCDGNVVQKNDASHCDNWGIHLWRSSKNHVVDNDFSYAIRCEKEAHACDSAAVLIESGSNDNRFDSNNATHSGDGIFVRALDAVVSAGNSFTGNDVSFAHNNGIEAWCPRNRWVRNKANRCGYGFWLGSSDETSVIDNEIQSNGVEGTNSANGTAGLAYIGGGVHVQITGNTIEGNAGPGIHIRGNPPAYPAHHFLIQGNSIRENDEGIRLEEADLVDIRNNEIANNKKKEVVQGDHVTNVTVLESPKRKVANPPRFTFNDAIRTAGTGEQMELELKDCQAADGKRPTVRWFFGDGAKEEAGQTARHAYAKPGFYRVSFVVDDGALAALGWTNVYVVSREPEYTDSSAAKWGGEAYRWKDGTVKLEDDVNSKVQGKSSLHVITNAGEDVAVWYPKNRDAAWNLTGRRALRLWIKFHNDNDGSFQNGTPIFRLVDSRAKGSEKTYIELKPKDNKNLLGLSVPYSEGRWLFNYFEIPLAGDATWERSAVGEPDIRHIDALELHADTWGAGFELWLDGVQFVK